MKTITKTTPTTPTHTPASKISPTQSQPVKVVAKRTKLRSWDHCKFLMVCPFKIVMYRKMHNLSQLVSKGMPVLADGLWAEFPSKGRKGHTLLKNVACAKQKCSLL